MPALYSSLRSLPQEEFDHTVRNFSEVKQDPSFRRSSGDDLAAAEQMLDLQPGVLGGYEFYSTNYNCAHCGKPIGIDDFVKAAILDAGHDRSFVAHTLLGRKRIVAHPQKVKCANCGTMTPLEMNYNTLIYACTQV